MTIVYICNKATGKYHLYLSKTADLVLVKNIYLQSLQRIRREEYRLKMLKIKYEIFRHAFYVTDRSFQEMRELHVVKKILHYFNHQFISNLDHHKNVSF